MALLSYSELFLLSLGITNNIISQVFVIIIPTTDIVPTISINMQNEIMIWGFKSSSINEGPAVMALKEWQHIVPISIKQPEQKSTIIEIRIILHKFFMDFLKFSAFMLI